ncbi:MAG: lysine--tRNA ligase [Patescibacteria group bacterium]
MFWLDRIYGQIEGELKGKIASGKTLLVRDEKTASGRVHIGSMRALVLHAAIAERLDEAKVKNTFKFEINDMDPMDGLPVYLDKAVYEKEMGKPLYAIPSPDGKAKNFAEYFGAEYIEAIALAGFTPELYRATELYFSGKMNEAIRLVLDKADAVRRVYKEVSGADRPSDWFALSVICENCGKIGTTKVSAWDGKEVTYTCYPTAVTWAVGCGHEGKVSPFDGKAKLPWKVEWAAKWFVLGVDVEGGGKDHYSKGGARDVARHIATEVFGYPEPFGVANEFFLIAGKKMSSSKGEGVSAKKIVELVPNKIFRLALYGKDINQQITFDPEGDTIPVLYDQYDKLAENYWEGKQDDYARLFTYIHPIKKSLFGKKRDIPSKQTLPRFSQVAFVVQMPHMDVYKEFPHANKTELAERATYAKKWLDEYAPEKFVFKLQEVMPAVVLDSEQKQSLKVLAEFMEQSNPDAETLHAKLHELKIFKAIYLAFLGKESGPKAGWFLASLDRAFVLKRLHEASI